MKFLNAAISISTIASTVQATSSSSDAMSLSGSKRLRNIQVYKSEKNGSSSSIVREQSLHDVRALQFLDISLSLSLSVDFSLPNDETSSPSTAASTTSVITTSAPSSATPTSLAPSAAPSMLTTLTKGDVTMSPASSAPSTAAPFATVIETPIVSSSPPTSAMTVCSFCEGSSIDSDLVIPGSDVTCSQVYEYAPTVMTGSDECTNVQLAEAVCCILDMPSDLGGDEDSTESMSYDMSMDSSTSWAPTPSVSGTGTTSSGSGAPTYAGTPTQPPIGLLPPVESGSTKMTCMISLMVGVTTSCWMIAGW